MFSQASTVNNYLEKHFYTKLKHYKLMSDKTYRKAHITNKK